MNEIIEEKNFLKQLRQIREEGGRLLWEDEEAFKAKVDQAPRNLFLSLGIDPEWFNILK